MWRPYANTAVPAVAAHHKMAAAAVNNSSGALGRMLSYGPGVTLLLGHSPLVVVVSSSDVSISGPLCSAIFTGGVSVSIRFIDILQRPSLTLP